MLYIIDLTIPFILIFLKIKVIVQKKKIESKMFKSLLKSSIFPNFLI